MIAVFPAKSAEPNEPETEEIFVMLGTTDERVQRIRAHRVPRTNRKSGTLCGLEARSNMSNRGLVGWKRVEGRRRTWAWAMALGGSLWMSAAQAQAQVFQTDPAKTPLPQPVGSAEL